MGCSSEDYRDGKIQDRNCVKNTVRQILRAQHRAVEVDEFRCETSCEESIERLLSPLREIERRRRPTTIPFMLVCKDGCKQFIGSGFVRREHRGHHVFRCVESPVFKVRGFERGSGNCVRLELLLPVKDKHHKKGVGKENDGMGEEFDSLGSHSSHHKGKRPCDFFGGHDIRTFRHTGVCITVDLDCFCGITCLDPITPLRSHGEDK